jgi:hypothetical protein
MTRPVERGQRRDHFGWPTLVKIAGSLPILPREKSDRCRPMTHGFSNKAGKEMVMSKVNTHRRAKWLPGKIWKRLF